MTETYLNPINCPSLPDIKDQFEPQRADLQHRHTSDAAQRTNEKSSTAGIISSSHELKQLQNNIKVPDQSKSEEASYHTSIEISKLYLETARWNPDFQARFKQLFCEYGEDFASIQKHLVDFTVNELREYYDFIKETDEYQQLGYKINPFQHDINSFSDFPQATCQVCHGSADLEYCDTCKRTYHLACMIQHTALNASSLSCPDCIKRLPKTVAHVHLRPQQNIQQTELCLNSSPHQSSSDETRSPTALRKRLSSQLDHDNEYGVDSPHAMSDLEEEDTAEAGEENSLDSFGNERIPATTETKISSESTAAVTSKQPSTAFPLQLQPRRRFTPPNIPWTVHETIELAKLLHKHGEHWDIIQQDEVYKELFEYKRKLRSLKLRWRFVLKSGWVSREGEYQGPMEYHTSDKNIVAARKRQKNEQVYYESNVIPQSYSTTKAHALPLHNLIVEALSDKQHQVLLRPDVPLLPLPVPLVHHPQHQDLLFTGRSDISLPPPVLSMHTLASVTSAHISQPGSTIVTNATAANLSTMTQPSSKYQPLAPTPKIATNRPLLPSFPNQLPDPFVQRSIQPLPQQQQNITNNNIITNTIMPLTLAQLQQEEYQCQRQQQQQRLQQQQQQQQQIQLRLAAMLKTQMALYRPAPPVYANPPAHFKDTQEHHV